MEQLLGDNVGEEEEEEGEDLFGDNLERWVHLFYTGIYVVYYIHVCVGMTCC